MTPQKNFNVYLGKGFCLCTLFPAFFDFFVLFLQIFLFVSRRFSYEFLHVPYAFFITESLPVNQVFCLTLQYLYTRSLTPFRLL